MTREEMDRAAHLLLQERQGQPLSLQLQQGVDQPWTVPRTQGPREFVYQQLREQLPSLDFNQTSQNIQQQQPRQIYRNHPTP